MNKSKFIQSSVYNNTRGYLPKIVTRRFGMREDSFSKSAYMADIKNLANCASPDSIFNVGVPPCDLAKKKIKGIIFADKSVTFSTADTASVAAFIAAVKLKATAARGGRVYPIWDILNFEDSTGDPATGSVGNLSTATIVTNDAVPAFRFGYNGTEARHRRLAAMNGASLDIFIVDDAYAVYGTLVGGEFGGFSVLQAYAYTSKFIVSDSVNQYSFRVTLGDITEYRENSQYIVANSGITAAAGIVNVQLSEFSKVGGAVKVLATADGGTNLEPVYTTAISALTWTATNLQTGLAHTVTSVADAPADDAYLVTLDSTMWTALGSGDKVQINGPSAAALSGANVKYYEMLPVIVTKP